MSLSPRSSEESVSPISLSRIQSLRNDLRGILDSGMDSDVSIKIGDREIKAHMIILKGFYFSN